MSNIKNLLKKDWYFQGFNGVPAVLNGPTRSMVYDMPKSLGFGYSASIEYFSHDVCYYLYAWEDLYKVRDELLKRFKTKKNYLNFLLKLDEKKCKQALKDYRILSKINLSKVNAKQLFSLWRKANDIYGSLLGVSHIVEGFSLTTEDQIRKLINENFPNNQPALLLLTTPRQHSFMSTEHYELCLVARSIKVAKLQSAGLEKILANKIINKKITAHQKKYFWKLNGYTSAKHLDNEFFVKEIQELFSKKVNFEKFIREFESLPKRTIQKDKFLKKIKNTELLDLLRISDTMFVIHDRRKEHMTQAITYLELTLEEIANRFNMPLADLHYIRPSELEMLPDIWPELKKRRQCSVYFLFPEGEIPVLIGAQAKKYFRKLEKTESFDKVVEIKGNSASPGKVTGTVKVCRGESELTKMREGDILVACMTQPEFLPAMKKASAVITDEGGLTCHAAIVARELGIPCIIGTKNATKVLKDGDVVEVDAGLGIIRIVKK